MAPGPFDQMKSSAFSLLLIDRSPEIMMPPKHETFPSPTKPVAPLVMPVTLMSYSSQLTKPAQEVLKGVLSQAR